MPPASTLVPSSFFVVLGYWTDLSSGECPLFWERLSFVDTLPEPLVIIVSFSLLEVEVLISTEDW